MIATLPYIEEKYRAFNKEVFGGELPAVRLELSRARSFLGALVSKRRRTWLFGPIEHYDYRLRISTRFDLPETTLEDILLHEMIHYYIAVKNIRDTSAHGHAFRDLMKQINREYGRHISITYRVPRPIE